MTDVKKLNNDESEPIENSLPIKKRPLSILIPKWIGKVILALFLILALIFQAPWKIITLLTIFFLACFVLPKRFRRWFWLGIAAAVLILLIWIFLPEDDTGWRPYTFDEEIAALEAKYTVPDEENAALIYDSLLDDYDDKTMNPEFLDSDLKSLTRSEQWISRDHPELAKWIQQQENTIQILFEVAKKEQCHFPFNVHLISDDKLGINLLPAFGSWGSLLICAGNNDIAEGRTEKGLEKYVCALRTANHLKQQQKILNFLLCFNIENLALRQLNRLVIEDEPTTEQLQFISDSIDNLQNNWSSDFSKCLETDELFWKNSFGLLYEINSEGQVRFSRNPAPVMSNLFFRRRLGGFFRDRQAHRIYAALSWFFLPSSTEKAALQIEKTMDKFRPMAQPDFNWTKEPAQQEMGFKLNYSYMVKEVIMKENDVEQYYHFFHDKYLENIIIRRGSKLLIAIRQYKDEHGSWPESLEEIKSAAPAEAFLDPVTGKPLEYENHGERFSLYGAKTNVWPR